MSLYSDLIENQWTMNDVDTMDINFFMELMSKGNKKKKDEMSAEDFFNRI